ncbi:MAG: glycosyltransferase family 4 protein, partial [Acidobacteriota bacterium]|nr:glycosyltransferase family 4 protein [Acidobacteriota bacterium]
MRIAYIAAGAGGMYCGSCLHDNTLAAALQRQGHDVALLPTYTPMRTDEENVSQREVFYGAVNVYLQGKSAFFRRTPRFFDRLLDGPRLLRWISRLGASTDAQELGGLALSVLQGEDGPQRKELERLVAWLRDVYRPELVQITNSMLLGLVRRLKQDLRVPVVVALQGEDLFVDELPEPARAAVVAEMRARAGEADAFIVPSRYYARHMQELLAIDEEKLKVVPLGIHLPAATDRSGKRKDSDPLTIGYLARVCPEKGLHVLLEAFYKLQDFPEGAAARLRIAGYLGPKDRAYLDEQLARVADWGLGDRVEYVGELDLDQKVRFLESLDILSVPTVYREPKGLFVLEALAHGVPVVQPRHGSFPEMIEATGGGLLVEPNSPTDLADGLHRLLADPADRRRRGEAGRRAVEE